MRIFVAQGVAYINTVLIFELSNGINTVFMKQITTSGLPGSFPFCTCCGKSFALTSDEVARMRAGEVVQPDLCPACSHPNGRSAFKVAAFAILLSAAISLNGILTAFSDYVGFILLVERPKMA